MEAIHLDISDAQSSPLKIETTPHPQNNGVGTCAGVPHTRRVLTLLLAGSLWTVLTTVIPVVVPSLGSISASPHPDWYTGADIIRFIEPVVTLPLSFALLSESGVLNRAHLRDPQAVVVTTAFMFGSAIYQQGAGFHSAANMLKHPIEDSLSAAEALNATEVPGVTALTSLLADAYSFARDDWEHLYGHYLYAAGGLIVSFAIQAAFMDWRTPKDGDLVGVVDRALFVAAAVAYGVIVGAVAIEFPSGAAVALVLTLVWGGGVLGCWALLFRGMKAGTTAVPIESSHPPLETPRPHPLIMRGGVRACWQRAWRGVFVYYPLLQVYCWAYILGFVIVVAWIISVGGFKNRTTALGG